MSNTLTIFIDGVPFHQLHKIPFSQAFPSRARLVPLLGYSTNCQIQLFTGENLDEVAFWCEWKFCPEGSPYRRIRRLLLLLAVAQRWYPAERLLHSFLDWLGSALSTKNLPIREIGPFAETGQSISSDESAHLSLPDHPGLRRFLHLHLENRPRRGAEAISAAKAYIEAWQHDFYRAFSGIVDAEGGYSRGRDLR